jgi:hypothetical protein
MSIDRRTRVIVRASVSNPAIRVSRDEEFRLQFEAVFEAGELAYVEIRDAQNGFIVALDAQQARFLGEFMQDHVTQVSPDQ